MTSIDYLDASDGYRPGVCNIGPAEIARRRRAGVAGIVAGVLLGVALIAAEASPLVRLAIGVPVFFGLFGLVQAQLRFCAGFALAGLRNLGPLGSQERVDDDAARRADRRRALLMGAGVAALSAGIAVAFALLPL